MAIVQSHKDSLYSTNKNKFHDRQNDAKTIALFFTAHVLSLDGFQSKRH